jgi:tetratricopeptide (TPR) repeat protein
MSSETTPSAAAGHTPPVSDTNPNGDGQLQATGLWRRLRWFLLVFVLIVIAGSLAGYASGLRQRSQAERQERALQAQQQFDLGVEDLAAGRYQLAQQRFEFVIQIDPGYPGVAEKLAEALVALNQPTARPTSQASPTPNLAPVEELYDQSMAALQAEDWSLAIETLLTLRSKDAGYRAVEVDGLMYQALRNRGIQRIANEGLLEEGMYDLARAQTFGPLDRDASNWKSWAELYLKANSYMGVNWGQAVAHFAEVYLVAPYMRNDAYIKYGISAQRYADLLVDTGDPCAAEEMYDQSLLAWDNATVYPTATEARDLCRTATFQPPPPEPTATPGGETPTPTETPEGGSGNGGEGDGG